MSNLLLFQTCLNHPAREAAGRCQECRGSFCRECLALFEERLVCAACLQTLSRKPTAVQRPWLGDIRMTAKVVLGFLFGWFAFFHLGNWLLNIPAQYHAEVLWQQLTESSDDDDE